MSAKTTNKVDWAFLLLILALAAFLRLYQLDAAPPGFSGDEAAYALDAVEVLDGQWRIFFPRTTGREPLWQYLLAGTFALFGPGIREQRTLAALVGTATVLTTYLMAGQMFRGPRSRLMAALTALGLATSYWHVSYSRIGYRLITLPLLETVCFYFLWRALNVGRRRDFVLAGFFLGLSMYTYLSSRFLSFVLLFFFLGQWLLAGSEAALLRKQFRLLILCVLVALLVFAPLGGHFLLHPEDFTLRAGQVSILNPIVNQGSVLGALGRNVVGALAAFGLRGDSSWEAGLPGRPVLDPALAVCFWAGLLICLMQIRRPAHLFCLAWWAIMLLPSVLSSFGPLSCRKAIGALPVVYVFPALSLAVVWDAARPLLAKVRLPARLVLPVLVAAPFCLTLWATCHDYFQVWAASEAPYHAFDGHAVDLVAHMERETNPKAVFILPWDPRRAKRHNYTIDFLYHGQAAYRYLEIDDETIPRELTAACQGKDTVHFINRWKVTKHDQANLKGYVVFLLEKYGQFVAEEEYRGYEMVTYRLPYAGVDFSAWPDFEPLGVTFGQALTLSDVAYGPAWPAEDVNGQKAPSGERAWVMAHWQREGTVEKDYKASVRLLDENGHVVGQVDKFLLDNAYRGTSGWEKGLKTIDYYLVPIAPATPPGAYQLRFLVYEEESGERLGTAVDVGSVEVTPALYPATVEPEHPLSLDLSEGIRLLGYDLSASPTVRPGDRISLALYWQARQKTTANYRAVMRLKNAGGETIAERESPPAGKSYPTTAWQAGEILRGWHDFIVPAAVEPGEYRLTVALKAGSETEQEAELTTLPVEGWARLFERPEIQHPIEADLGGLVALLGYDLPAEQVQAGESLPLTLYWQALRPLDTSYTAFVHLLDGQSRIWGQQDRIPAGRPTTSWLEGEIVVDEYKLAVGAEAPAGQYTIEVGLYDPASGERLSVLSESRADRILLGQVRVR